MIFNSSEHLLLVKPIQHEHIGFLDTACLVFSKVLNIHSLLGVLLHLVLRFLRAARIASIGKVTSV